jgi:type II secretory pathway component GspD/PulD (secretin)
MHARQWMATIMLVLALGGITANGQTRQMTVREDRGQTAMATKIYTLHHVGAGDLAPFVEQAVKAMNPASSAIAGRSATGEFLSVAMPISAVAAVDAMIQALDRPPPKEQSPGIAGTGATRGWHRPQHRSSAAMVEMLQAVANGQAEVFRDPQSGLIYWQGSASADAAIRQALSGDETPPAEALHVILGNNDPKLLTKTYILKHADPYEIRGILREAVQATRISGAHTGVECLKYNDGTGVVIVTAEAYRFAQQPGGGISIDELVVILDQPEAGEPPDDAILMFPQHRRADAVAEGLRNVALTRPNDPQELDAGDSEAFVDPELNAVIVNTPPFGRKTASTWIQVMDQPIPQIRLVCRAYELHAESEDRFGADYQAWRNGHGAQVLSTGAAAEDAGQTTYLHFRPQWDVRFFDALVATGKSTIMAQGEGVIVNRREFHFGPGRIDDPGLHLRVTPFISDETTSLDIQAAVVSSTGDEARISRSGYASRVAIATRGGRIVLGNLDKAAATGEKASGSSWLGRLFGGGNDSGRLHRIVIVLECHLTGTQDSPPVAP